MRRILVTLLVPAAVVAAFAPPVRAAAAPGTAAPPERAARADRSTAPAGEATERTPVDPAALARQYAEPAGAARLPASPTLADLERLAELRSPALRAAFYRWKAAVEKAGYADVFPDPMFTFAQFVENVETRVGPQERRMALRQTLPWFGTLQAREDAAAAAARAAWERFEAERLRVLRDVRRAWYEYAYAAREITITRETLDLVRYWERVAREKYRVDLAKHSAVIQAQVELGMLEDRLRTVEARVAPLEARIRELLALPDTVHVAAPDSIAVDGPPVDRDALTHAVLERNPDLLALAREIEARRARVRLAGKASWPRVTLGVDWVETGPAVDPTLPESGKDAWMASVGISLPIWFGDNAARRHEASARLRESEYRLDDARHAVVRVIEDHLFGYDDALRKTRLYRDGLIPKARQSLGATYTAYRAGTVDFVSVLDAERVLLDFRLRLERARADLGIHRAELERLAGISLDTIRE